MYYVNENLINLNRIFDQNSRDGYIRMDLNENPVGLSEEFIKKTLEKVTPEMVAKYPEQLEFTTMLAEYLGVEVPNICLTNGSAEAVRYAMEAYSRPGGKVVSVAPSYAMYAVFSNMYGRVHVPVKYNDDLSFDVDNIVEAIKDDVDLLYIVNPNNPVGDAYTEEEMARIINSAIANEVTVLIDEAYHYFYPNTFLHFAMENDHVFVTRTFSKMFSLAGCRLGYVVGRPDGVALMQKLCTPHNINAFSMLFAKEILTTPGMLDSMVKKQREGKQYLVDELKKYGYTVNAKEGNFIFIKPNTDADVVVKRMKEEKKILIKSYSGIGSFGKVLRVSTGEKEVMDRFITALLEVDC